ncbi:MAG: efflux RND transporter periplasmic adaptor subunit [Bacillota bacterium]|nr:efflux RND transporter periplasmic adaptor subunit [Bacillota bacterium]
MNYEIKNIKPIRNKIINKSIVIFFSLILFFTFFSKTINNLTLPKVTYETPASGSLVKVVTCSGHVQAKKTQELYLASNMKVLKVMVKAGDKVKKGQAIMSLDTKEVEIQLENEKARYEQKRLALQKLVNAGAAGMLNIRDKDIDNTRLALDNMQERLSQAESQYQTGAASLEDLKKARTDCDNAKRDYEMALLSKSNAVSDSNGDIKSAQLDMEIQQRTIEQLSEQVKLNNVTSPIDGVISELNCEEGTMANNSQPLYKISDTSSGFQFVGEINADSAEYLNTGDDAVITVNSSNGMAIHGKLAGISDSQTQRGIKKNIYIDVTDEGLLGGETGSVEIQKDTKSYSILVPNSSIGQDNSGSFVYVMNERNGPLGNEFYVKKIHVSVDESDNLKTGLKGGLTSKDKIIVNSNKILADGSKVLPTE